MGEALRSVRLEIVVDTNKDTVRRTFECSDLDEAAERLEEFIEDWRGG